ncbi:helix-turn-helix transcriptional regulator [Streptomyces alkaliterrae]|uniref:ArsR family transcriptional regulator n=1 Tax=Streptomyces alkaliterrae TaxID=2213162 RepID=A0A5P0YN99_9ACTN|nr:ArsR family transcriptional regulator [Streptomyces alkaliterrae]MQS00902.1 ArsR family transcriptional regulator [Streptomyces alkaliterrae]
MKNAGTAQQQVTATHAATGGGLPAPADEQHGTRNKVARSILDHGPSTAAELAERLELTQAAVRRHLDALVAEGVVEARAQRVYGSRGRGRPAKVFALTDCGRDAFDQAYDELATDAMRWIAQAAGGGAAGEAAVAAFARARVAAQAERFRERVENAAPDERTRVLAEALTEDGYAATARGAPASTGEQLCQHHCPVAHAAERFPQLCEAETELFSRLLGTHVQRLATIAHGDGVCTTFVPRASRPGPRHGAESQTPPHQDPGQPPEQPQTSTSPKTSNASTRTAGRNPA